ncbi:MAG: hypothetical protein V1836_03955 [Candidatus Aenigmatarchaeota archaeon]
MNQTAFGVAKTEELASLKNRVADLERMLRSASMLRLTQKKRIILNEVEKMSGKKTFTSTVDAVSRNLSIPYSTVKWNMMKMRSCGLLDANISMPVTVTEAGRIAIRLSEA